ncbi:MAG: hypothetical protein QOE23_410 [Pseudonocardiales bacterium]|nr:hypothetical protein [Pseudonocardiales bacterium]
MTFIRQAAWSTEAEQAFGWSTSLIWYAVAIREMKKLTPRLGEFRPLALEANAIGNELTRAAQQRYEFLIQSMKPIIRGWSDPRGLGYQSQVHDSFLPPNACPRHDGKPVIWHECSASADRIAQVYW